MLWGRFDQFITAIIPAKDLRTQLRTGGASLGGGRLSATWSALVAAPSPSWLAVATAGAVRHPYASPTTRRL